MPLRKVSDLEETVAAASGVFHDVCSEEPPYHTAEELWEGLKQGDEGARLLFVCFLRLRKNERTRCSVEKAIAAGGKRWVAVLIEEAWRPLFTDAPPSSFVPRKTKICYCDRGK